MCPVILGVLLGDHMEVNLRRALNLSSGDWSILYGSKLAVVLCILVFLSLTLPFIVRAIGPRSRGKNKA